MPQEVQLFTAIFAALGFAAGAMLLSALSVPFAPLMVLSIGAFALLVRLGDALDSYVERRRSKQRGLLLALGTCLAGLSGCAHAPAPRVVAEPAQVDRVECAGTCMLTIAGPSALILVLE